MSNIFRKSYTLPIPDGAELVTVKSVPSAKFKRKGKTITAPLTEKGDRVRIFSPFFYGTVDGKPVRLFTDAVASQQRLAELIRKSERKESGLVDPYECHRRRPLAEHIDEWAAMMRNDITRKGQSASAPSGVRVRGEKHIRYSVTCVRRITEDCKMAVMGDISASRVQGYLAELRKDPSVRQLDPSKSEYTRSELADLLDVNAEQVTDLLRRHRLAGHGEGKARRYSKETAERLCELRSKGASIKTCNLHLAAVKSFCRWLVRDRRMSENPLDHLDGGNVKLDRRHDRRILDENELRMVIEAARSSKVEFRSLGGIDRSLLYQTACATGFRAGELAALCPKDFNLDGDAPDVRLSASFAKNGKACVQPLPADLAALLRTYLHGKPAESPVWGGKWYARAADMLRIELDVCGIPYVIEGADGPLFADFHCLRHSFVAMLDKSGATLKEAMQLARHSDPRLTMAVYGRARLHDLAGAVDRLPSLSESPVKQSQPEILKATGTDGGFHSARLPFPCRADDEPCKSMGANDEGQSSRGQTLGIAQVVDGIEDDSTCKSVIRHDEENADGSRTHLKPGCSRLPGRPAPALG